MINFYLSRDLFNWCSWTTKHWKHWKKEKKKKKYPNLVQLFFVLFVICNHYSLQLYLFLEGRLPFHLKHILFAISSSSLQDSSDFSILDDISSRLATKRCPGNHEAISSILCLLYNDTWKLSKNTLPWRFFKIFLLYFYQNVNSW